MLASDEAIGTHPQASEPDNTALKQVVEKRRRQRNHFINDEAECDEDDSDFEDDSEDLGILNEFIDDEASQDSADFYARVDRVLDEVYIPIVIFTFLQLFLYS